MKRSAHVIANRRAEAVLGAVLFLGGAYLIHDAYERRGVDAPWWTRPFTFW